jgi:hypothetical protein
MVKHPNSNPNQGVNIGLIVVIFFLVILVIGTGYCYEGFGNVFANYKIPFVGEKVPSLQNLTVPKFNNYQTSNEPVVTDPNQIKSLDEEASEKIAEAVAVQQEAQAVIDEELEAMEERYENSNRIEPLHRISPGQNQGFLENNVPGIETFSARRLTQPKPRARPLAARKPAGARPRAPVVRRTVVRKPMARKPMSRR